MCELLVLVDECRDVGKGFSVFYTRTVGVESFGVRGGDIALVLGKSVLWELVI